MLGSAPTPLPAIPTEAYFQGSAPANMTGRTQDFYFAYAEDVFMCLDRSEQARVFRDKSWHPWATYEDLVNGQDWTAVEFGGDYVFWKFVSDVSYLQRPINGSILLSQDCTSECSAASETCSDPIRAGPSHNLWSGPKNNMIYDRSTPCNLRRKWTDKYQATGLANRANSVLTHETTTFSIAVLVITPQPEEFPDVQTVVRVTWEFHQSGTISSSVSLNSTSQVHSYWFGIVGVVLFFGCLNFLNGGFQLRRGIKLDKSDKMRVEYMRMGTLDCSIALSTMGIAIANLALELGPPHVTEDLVRALELSEQQAYFEVLKSIVNYNDKLDNLHSVAYMLLCVMFMRLVLYFSLHPRMAVLTATLSRIADGMFHFLIYFLLVFLFLAYVGYWRFSVDNFVSFGTFSKTFYTQFQMLCGNFPFPSNVPGTDYYLYLALFVMVVFILLINFLLAIVVDAFSLVTDENKHHHYHKNVALDAKDIAMSLYHRRVYKFPHTGALYAYLDSKRADPTTTVTAAELFQNVKLVADKPGFTDEKHAQDFIDFYANKLFDDNGVSVLAYDPAAASQDFEEDDI